MKITNRLITGILLITLFSCRADSASRPQETPQKVPRIVYEVYPDEWYHQQAKLWKAELDKNPSSEEAWYNYYNANRYARFDDVNQPERKKRLDQIIEEMNKAIPNTYTSYLLTYWNDWAGDRMDQVEAAYKINPDRPDTYYAFISQAVREGDNQKLELFCDKLYKSQDIAPWLLNYNYNVLMSVEKNGVLITNGDNDTYPVWVLQQALSIRPDVKMINLSMLTLEDYFKNQLQRAGIELDYNELKNSAKEQVQKNSGGYQGAFLHAFIHALLQKYPETPLYFALTVYDAYTQPFEEGLFLTGLAYKYSKNRFDNLALLKKTVETQFRLDYLNVDFYGEFFPGRRLASRLQMNYVAPLMMLAEHYDNSGDRLAATRWGKLALHIAEQGGSPGAIEKIKMKLNK